MVRQSPGLPCQETELLLRLQTLFLPEHTREYHDLRDAGILSDDDRKRLLSLLEQRDHQNAERLEIVAELGRLRGVSLGEMIWQQW